MNVTLKHIASMLLSVLSLASLSSCHDEPSYDNDVYGNFDALWSIIDEHYCFFKYKNVDWQATGNKYRAMLQPHMTSQELYDVCSEMLKELKDGHTNLVAPWDVSRYWIWEQYPVNYDERVIDEHYLNFNYKKASGIKYGLLRNNIGYLYYGSFDNGVGEGNLDAILSNLATTDALILDVRSNGGGLLTNVEPIVGRFITEKLHAGAISHKTGPAHDAFSEPYDYYFSPTSTHRVKYQKPIIVLANRASFSATNNFVSVMKSLPQVRVVGDVTGGGCGLPFTSELPNGWTVRFSASAITDAQGNLTEFGVEPDYKVDATQEHLNQGIDDIMEKAFDVAAALITQQAN